MKTAIDTELLEVSNALRIVLTQPDDSWLRRAVDRIRAEVPGHGQAHGDPEAAVAEFNLFL